LTRTSLPWVPKRQLQTNPVQPRSTGYSISVLGEHINGCVTFMLMFAV
jgi:hypothetical protein